MITIIQYAVLTGDDYKPEFPSHWKLGKLLSSSSHPIIDGTLHTLIYESI